MLKTQPASPLRFAGDLDLFGADVCRGLTDVDHVLNALCWSEDPSLPTHLDLILNERLASRGSRLLSRLALATAHGLDLPGGQVVRFGVIIEAMQQASLLLGARLGSASPAQDQWALLQEAERGTAVRLGHLLISSAYVALAELDRDLDLPSLIVEVHDVINRTVRRMSGAPDTQQRGNPALCALPLVLPIVASGHLRLVSEARAAGECLAITEPLFEAHFQGTVEDPFDPHQGSQRRPISNTRTEDLSPKGLLLSEDPRPALHKAREMARGWPRQSGAPLIQLSELLLAHLS